MNTNCQCKRYVLVLFIISIVFGCKEDKKKKVSISGTGSENINQPTTITEEETLALSRSVIFGEKGSKEIVELLGDNSDTRRKIAQKQRDEERRKDSIKKERKRLLDSVNSANEEKAKTARKRAKKRFLDSVNSANEKKAKAAGRRTKKRFLDSVNKTKIKVTKSDEKFNGAIIRYDKQEQHEIDQSSQTKATQKIIREGFYSVSIDGDQKIHYRGSSKITFITMEDIKYEDFVIPGKTMITGYTALQRDRMMVNFEGVIIDKKVKSVRKMKIYELDGSEGIKVNLDAQISKSQGVNTGSKILRSVTGKLLKNDITSTIVTDGNSYSNRKIQGSFILKESKPFLIKTEYYE